MLLLLPSKYTRREIPNHTCSPELSTTLTDEEMSLLEDWKREGILFECAPGLYDDWYWMYASVVSPEAVQRTKVVTNDEMRDHRCGSPYCAHFTIARRCYLFLSFYGMRKAW